MSSNTKNFSKNLASFFSWWKNELVDMLPAFLKKSVFPSDNLLLVLYNRQQTIRFFYKKNGTFKQLGECLENADTDEVQKIISPVRSKHPTIILRLDDSFGLKRQIELPLAAASDIDAVLFHQLDSLSPYPADQVYYVTQITHRNYKTEKLAADLYLVPGNDFDPVIKRMEQWKIKIDIADIVMETELAMPCVNFLPETSTGNAGKNIGSKITKVLLVTNLLLLLAIVISQPLKQYMQTEALESQLETARIKAKVAVKLRQKIDNLNNQSAFLNKLKQTATPVLSILNELSAILPDQTWLEQISINSDEVKFSGNSSKATTLISLIEKSPFFHDVTFEDAVIFQQRLNAEHFKISARLAKANSENE